MGYDLFKLKTEPTKIPRNYEYHEFLANYFPDSNEAFIYLELEEFKECIENKLKDEATKFKEEIQATLRELEANGGSLWLTEL